MCDQRPIEIFQIIARSIENMYDILDSEWDSLTMTNNGLSRSSSMQKITKKDSKASPKADQNKNKSANTEFDDLLNSVLHKETKPQRQNSNSPPSGNRQRIDSLETQQEEIRWSHSNRHSTQHPSGFQRTSFGINLSHKEIEDHGISHHFGNTEKSIMNPSKVNDSVVSSRNMRPPLRPKDNLQTQSFNFADTSASVIPEEDPALTNSSHDRSSTFKRRSSIDSRSEVTDDVLPLRNKPFAGGTAHSVTFDTIKEDAFPHINKSQSCVMSGFKNDGQQNTSSHNFFQAKDKLQSKSASLKVGGEAEGVVSPPKQLKEVIAQYENQLESLKSTYQKQIAHLQECLNAQLIENRTLRQTLMDQTNKLLQQERSRTHRIHEEEVSRLKDIFHWQQKKQEETYTLEIQSLKASLNMLNGHDDWLKTHQKPLQQNIQFMQVQLRSKEQRLENKSKLLEQREIELERKESDLSIRMRKQEERIRTEEKRLTHMEFQFKKMMMEEKKALSEQKQELAFELSSMECDFHKRKEELGLKQKELSLELEALEQEKRSLQSLNSQAMAKHRSNLEELHRQKERLKDLEIQLIHKLKVVELKARELAFEGNNQEDCVVLKHNNYLDQSYSKSKNHQSIQKKLNNSNSMSVMSKTKQRFNLLDKNTKSRTNIGDKKKIDLSSYMSRMESNIHSRHL